MSNYTVTLAVPYPLGMPFAFAFPAKDPSDILPGVLDCTAYLSANGFTLTGATVSVDSTLTLVSSGVVTVNSVKTGAWAKVSGGVSGTSPNIKFVLSMTDALDSNVDDLVVVVTQPVQSRP